MSVNDQLARITKSLPLVSSPSLCRFLRYIVEETVAGRSSGIKEQVLGLEVFDRGQDFNPRLDPIVRVQARNLRSRLAKYYEGPGAADPIRIELPKGTYIPVFHHVGPTDTAPGEDTAPAPGTEATPAVAAPASVSLMPAPPPRSPVAVRRQLRPRFVVAAVILAVLLTGVTVLWISHTYAAPKAALQIDSLAQGRASSRSSTKCTSRAKTRYSRGVDPSSEFRTAKATASCVRGGGVAEPVGDVPPVFGIPRSL